MFYRGEGGPQNYAEAAKWFMRTVEPRTDGGPRIIYNFFRVPGLGEILGRGISEIMELRERLAEQDDYERKCVSSAKYYLGFMYWHGQGVRQNYEEAVKWFRDSADSGHNDEAQYWLGNAFFSGQGVKQDNEIAEIWYRYSAEQGNAEAQYSLGGINLRGQGVPQNYDKALSWYRKAADQGHSGAETTIGDMYLNGTGVGKDQGEAVKWYTRAAQKGNPAARSRLLKIIGDLPKDNLVHR